MIRIVESNFIISAMKPRDYPVSPYWDIAFVGKSNVGKSSLINTVLGRKAIAKISSTPGKTRLINFFLIRFKIDKDKTDGYVNFVDLPGYGYAKVSKSARESWKKMILAYFEQRAQLKGVVVLVDARHQSDPKDIIMMQMLKDRNIPFIIIATKSDKIPKSKVRNQLHKLQNGFDIGKDNIFAFSSLKKTGVENVSNWIGSQIL